MIAVLRPEGAARKGRPFGAFLMPYTAAMTPKQTRRLRFNKLDGKRIGIARALVDLIDVYVTHGHVSVEGIEAIRRRADEYERTDQLAEEARRHMHDVSSC